MTAKIDRIRVLSRKFRQAIEVTLMNGMLPDDMSNFPRGACGNSALLLGTFLTNEGMGVFTYTFGTYSEKHSSKINSHAWISQGSLIIDVTHDQFSQKCKNDFVFLDQSWHNRFRPFEQDGEAYLLESDVLRRTFDIIMANYNTV